ncbi:MAG: ParB/RepB/Spo0J family partition protein [Ostreibacterium sp.]
MKKRGLGKGLEALLGSEVATEQYLAGTQANYLMVTIEQLVPNPFQPRTLFDESAIETLADSIRQHGIIQPLAVRPLSGEGNHFEIIAGERRFRAAKLAKINRIPVVIHYVSDTDSATFALIENLQREDLNFIEKAKGMQRLITDFKLTHADCGQLLGQSRSAVSNTLRLLDLSDDVQNAVINKVIDMGHARALLAVEQAQQHTLLQQIKINGLSVRETEKLVKGAQVVTIPQSRKQKSDYIKQAEIQLSEQLQTKVSISQQSQGNGKITLAFSNEDMLKKLTHQLGIN